MIVACTAVAVLAAAGGLPAWRVCGRWVEALLLSPAVGALVLTPGAVLAVATDLPPVVGATGGILIANLLAWRWGAHLPRWRPDAPPAAVAVVVLACGAIAALYLARPPVEWDAHSIWLLRADWFATGGQPARDAVTLAGFAHPDYPPLLPAAAGTASRLVAGHLDWRAGQAVIAAVGWSLFASAQLVVLDGVRNRAVGAIGGVLGTVVITATLGQGVASGEADLAASGAVALAAAALLVRREPHLLGVGLVAATIAALVKGESFVAAILVVGVAAVVRGGSIRRRWLAVPLVAGAAWLLVARVLGAESYLAGADRSAGAIPDRAVTSLGRVLGELGTPAAGALIATGLVVLARPAALRRLAPVWAVVVGSVVALVVVYAIGDLPIDQWLDDSARRVSAGPLVLASIAAVVAVDESLVVARGEPGHAEPSRDGPRAPGLSGRRSTSPAGGGR